MKISWSKRAIEHLFALRNYIAQDSPGSAEQVQGRILESVELLDQFPNAGRPGRILGTRELVVTGTPYVIPYRIRRNWIEIIAVFHGRQKWPKRL